MAVTAELTDLDFARIEYERLLAHNGMSSDKDSDGTYYYSKTQTWWVMFQAGFRSGRKSAGGTCEF